MKSHVAVSMGSLALSLIWLSVAVASSPPTPLQDATPEQITFFESKIRPILADNCYTCHGSQAQMAGLRLDTATGAQKVITPGDPEKSALIKAVRHTGPIKMPPQGKKLKPEEIANLEVWVKMGAPWPKASAQSKPAGPNLWSLRPVRKPAVPKIAGAKNPIDGFILAGLTAKRLRPATPADPRTLLRRVTYDLTGLPPSQGEMDAFLADKSPEAYEKAVDRLLKSPRYGERWARLWLDVARYADTKGYVFEEDRNYYHAYTYRDWVIRAFNEDLPYDKFIIQQLAADCLPEVKNGDDKRPLAALGFLTVGRRFLNYQPDIIDDRIDVTMRGFQGFTVSCARCHDHKFDPIPTQDYYSLYGVFASSIETAAPISDKSIRNPWERYSRQVSDAEGKVRNIVLSEIKRLREVNKDPKALKDDAKQALQTLREGQFPDQPKLAKLMPAFTPEERDKLSALKKELDALKAAAPPTPEFAMAMVDNPKPFDVPVFKRGNPGSKGEIAPRRFLAALCGPDEDRERWTEGSGRLQLAQAIASRDNPLTARVFVNRVWQGHFGAGLVRTPSDFGHQGEKPTHPELLDWLASYFMETGWSIKKLHRMIVTSATYRQSSTVSKEAMNADPENRMWSHQNRRRLDMEQMRDSMMLAAGRLDLSQVGGKSVDLWAQPFVGRRAVYGFIERQNLPGVFKTFDFASPDSTSPRRFMTTVPQQALFFMNSPFSVEQARALASRPEIVGTDNEAQKVRRLYQLLFARLPSPDETAAAVAYLKASSSAVVEAPASPWRYGYGAYDASQKRLTSFTPFPFFGENSYRVGKAFPDPKLGYLVLNAMGGHPGRDASLCVVRRWVAPENMTVKVAGFLGHRQSQGDGVRGRVVTREGLLGEWQVRNSTAKTEVSSLAVRRGDVLDFVVDCIGTEGFDSFVWAPTVVGENGKAWSAHSEFGPPPGPGLTRLALYAQALMMTNEFLFVD